MQLNLPASMHGERTKDGLHVSATDVSIGQVARYVLNLGGAARPLSADLRHEVRRLAHAALAACEKEDAN